MPANPEEAMRLQTENLESAIQSGASSRVISRRSSRPPSGHNSCFASGIHTPSGLSTPGGRHRHSHLPNAGGRLVLISIHIFNAIANHIDCFNIDKQDSGF